MPREESKLEAVQRPLSTRADCEQRLGRAQTIDAGRYGAIYTEADSVREGGSDEPGRAISLGHSAADDKLLPGGPGERSMHAVRTQLPATRPFRMDTLARKEARAEGSMMADGLGPFGTLLQQQRRAAGLSQAELGERAGLSRQGISDLELAPIGHGRREGLPAQR
jgi:DNA-binding XRE family transcriptional regulator